MIASCDTQASAEVVNHSEESCLPPHWRPEGLDAAIERNTDYQCDVEPIDMLIPILLGNGLVCDVRLLRIVAP